MLFSDACTWLTACLSFVDSPDKGSTTFDRGSHLIILSAGKTRNCTNSKLLNDSVCKKISYLWSLGVYFKSSPSWRGYLQIFCTGVSRKPAREMSIICCKRRQASKKCLYLPCFISRCNSAHATGCVLQYSEYMEKPSSWEGEKDIKEYEQIVRKTFITLVLVCVKEPVVGSRSQSHSDEGFQGCISFLGPWKTFSGTCRCPQCCWRLSLAVHQ